MDLNKIGVFQDLQNKMSYLSQRQGQLADNIANADTPGYMAKDLAPFKSHLSSTTQLTPTVTNPGHIGLNNGGYKSKTDKKAYETTQDGNSVTLEDQMNKVGQTVADYNATAGLYQKQLAMMQTAIGK